MAGNWVPAVKGSHRCLEKERFMSIVGLKRRISEKKDLVRFGRRSRLANQPPTTK